MKKLFIIDGNSLVNRAYYAIPLLVSHDGVYSNAVFGFVNCLIKLITEEKPDYLFVAFDHARKTFRNQIFEDYKGTRKATPNELRSQFPILKNLLQEMQIKCYEQEGIEADDIIGTITKHSNCLNYIITGDRDSLQLIDQNTKVWLTQRGITDIKEVTLENVKELYKLNVDEFVYFKGLAGDSSDNIPGVPGIGEKRAIDLINEYKTIDNLYEHIEDFKGKLKENLINGKESCYMSMQLGKIKTDCDFKFNIEDFTYPFPFSNKVKDLFKQYSFSSLLNKSKLFENATQLSMDFETNQIDNLSNIDSIFNNINGYISLYENKQNLQIFTDKVYSISKESDSYSQIIEKLSVKLKTIFENKDILKIMANIKNFMHIFKLDNFENAFDLAIASHLCLGSLKPEEFDAVSDFYSVYKDLNNKLIQKELIDYYNNIEIPLIKVLYSMEKDGFNIDKEELLKLSNELKIELNELYNKIIEFSSNKNLNINSPKQVSQFLFEELGLSDKGNKKHSTGAENLQAIESQHEVVSLILRYRKVAKLCTTYIQPYEVLSSKDTLIHTVFNQTQTATGRLSSSEPNLQNIPVRDNEGRLLRKIFISRFTNGTIISADYNQIELKLLANFSQDENLINDYNRGADIHSITASMVFGVDLTQVTDTQRRLAKAVNFGIVYGISSFGLSKNLDMSVKEAAKYIDIYFKTYPGVKNYLDNLIKDAKELGYVKTLFGRYRDVPELKSSNGMTRILGERIAMNTPLQGSASDLIKVAMINIYKEIKNKNLKSKLILQIHDELIIDTYPGEEEIIKNILKEQMQNVYTFKVPLQISIGMGKSLYEAK